MNSGIVVKEEESGIWSIGLDINENNSLSLQSFERLDAIINDLADNREVQCLIFHSLRSGIFSQGLNLESVSSLDEKGAATFIDYFFDILEKIYLLPFPVISALGGHAMGYGCMIALVSDYRFMVPQARLGLPEVKLGIRVPVFIARLLQELVGVVLANQHIMEGAAWKGTECERIGLVDRLMDADALLAHSVKQGRKFLRNSRNAIHESKLAMRRRDNLDDIIKFDKVKTLEAIASDDAREGIAAAVEGRRPVFKS
jgi:enoyl-CoA hydratase/carnithine racemase